MSNHDILKAHVKELFELRLQELMQRFNITEQEAADFLISFMVRNYEEGKNNG